MTFQNPWGLLALAAVPLLIALYILKQKHREVRVPALLLWKRTQTLMQASTPWQKLRRSLLFFLQLLCVTLLALCVAHPVVESDNLYDEITVIVDASASMQATEGGKTRYELALETCRDMADSLRRGQKMSVIFAGDMVYPAVSHSDSRHEIREALSSYPGCLYAGSDTESALMLAESMRTDGVNSQILLLTDCDFSTEKDYIRCVNLSTSSANAAILRFSCGNTGSSLMAMSIVESFGGDRTVTLELLADGMLADAQKVSLRADTAETVYWNDVPAEAELLTVRIAEEDILAADNTCFCAVNTAEKKKILIVSDSGFFWEKALSAISDDEIYRVTPSDYSDEAAREYDMCLFDCFSPAALPERCSCWFISPDTDACGLVPGELLRGTSLTAGTDSTSARIAAYLNPGAILLSAFREYSPDSTWQKVLLCGEYPVLCTRTEASGRHVAVFAFDIHNSNLALLKEFPILTRNLLSWTLPEMTEGDGTVTAGGTVSVHPLTYAKEIRVLSPAETSVSLKNGSFTASLPGLYRIEQTVARNDGSETSDTVKKGYVMSVIPAAESAMQGSGLGETEGKQTNQTFKGQRDLRPWLLLAIALLMLTEWWVYHHENQL